MKRSLFLLIFTVAILWLPLISEGQIISTVAGTGVAGNTGDGGPATAAQMYYPFGLTFDNGGNLYVADLNNNRIRKITPGGSITMFAGTGVSGYSGDGGPASSARLQNPTSMVFDSHGNMFITDHNNQRIRKVTPSGIINTIAGNGITGFSGDGGPASAATLYSPTGIAIDAIGNLFFCDQGNQVVRKIDTNGIITSVVGNLAGTFSGDGGPATTASIYAPNDLVIDGNGNLIISDAGNNRIRKVDTNGIITTIAGNGGTGFSGDGGPATAASIYNPVGLALDGNGNLLFAAQNHHRIRVINTVGIISTLVGTGTAGFSGDGGLATTAQLNNPCDVAMNSSGDLYIADTHNDRIRKVACATFSAGTIAGQSDVCAGSSIVFTNSVSGGGWSSSNTSIATIGSTGTVIAVASGTSTISYSITGSCGTAVATKIITVNSTPTITLGANPAICKGSTTVALPYSAATGSPLSYTMAWHSTAIANGFSNINPNGIIRAFAGNTTVGYSGDGGPATSAELGGVYGIAADGNGNFYISDYGNYRIRKVNATGVISTFAGSGITGFSGDGGAASAAQLGFPAGISIDLSGNIFFADVWNYRVRKISTSGIITTIAGNGTPSYSGDGGAATNAATRPFGITIDVSGNIYIAEMDNHVIRKISTSGIITTVAGNGFSGFSGDGGQATNAQLYYPSSVKVDGSGNLYIADRTNHRIRKINTSGIITTVAGNGTQSYGGDGGPASSAVLNTPFDIAIDNTGSLYFTDLGNNRIRRIDPSGKLTTIAGYFWGFGMPGSIHLGGDGGPATAAELYGPTGLILDPSGAIYFSDNYNNIVRKISGQTSLPTSPIPIPVPGSALAGVYTATLTVSNGSCSSISYPVSVTIDSTPVLDTISGLSIVNMGSTISLSNATAGGVWSSTSATIATVSSAGVVSGIAPGIDTIRYTVTNSCGAASSFKVITVNPVVASSSCKIITTIVGTGVSGHIGDGGPATAARVTYPLGIVQDRNGNIYFADYVDLTVRKIDTIGVITTIAGGGTIFPGDGGPATSAVLQGPWDITVDTNGNLYFSDAHCIRKVSAAGIISTFSGAHSVNSFAGDGGPASGALFNGPAGIAIDRMGSIYIADVSNHRIRKISSAGIITTIAGNGSATFSGDGGPATSAGLRQPTGLTVDENLDVYFTDYQARVRKISQITGTIHTVAGTGIIGYSGDGGPATAAELTGIFDVAIDQNRNLYIADYSNNRIRKVDSLGIITTVAGNGTGGFNGDGGQASLTQIYQPIGMCVTSDGSTLLFSDWQNHRVRKISNPVAPIAGPSLVSVGSSIPLSSITSGGTWSSSNPSLATVGSTGIVTGASSGIATISYTVITACGTSVATKVVTVTTSSATACNIITTIAGNGTSGYSGDGGSATSAMLSGPVGVAKDNNGNVYIADGGNNVIRKVSNSGIITTFAGTGTAGFSGDGGPASAAQLDFPRALAIDASGNLYIGDVNNFRIRKVSTTGIISTIAGIGLHGYSGDGGPATSATLMEVSQIVIDKSGNILFADRVSNNIRKINTGGIISTVAGDGTHGYYGDGGPATAAAMRWPTGLAVDSIGNLYIGDWRNQRVRFVNAAGIISTIAGIGMSGLSGDGGPATAASVSPESVAIDIAGNLYIADNHSAIRQIDPSGIITTIAGIYGLSGYSGDGGPATAAEISSSPYYLDIDILGNLYFADLGNNAIRKVVLPLSARSILGTSSVSVGSAITLSISAGGGTWSSNNPSIATVGSTGIVIGISAGIDTISYTVTNACGSVVATKVVTVTALVSGGGCGIITTFAGNGTAGYSGDGGPAAVASINNPLSVNMDAFGNLYIGGNLNHSVRVVSPAGIISTIAGTGASGFSGDGGPATAAQLSFVAATATDAAGNIYIADPGNNRIRKVNPSGIITTFAGNGVAGYSGDGGPSTSASLFSPFGVAVDAIGNVYIADENNNRIRKVNTTGIISTYAGNGTAGFSGDGGPATAAALDGLTSIRFDNLGNGYIADQYNNRIRKVDLSGIITTSVGNGTAGYSGDGGIATNAQLNYPTGIAIDNIGNVYIADQNNSVVRRVNPSGVISTFAGNGAIGYAGDGGTATAAGLNIPWGICVDNATNDVYISDGFNNRIRKVTPFSSLAPIGGTSFVSVGSTITLSNTTTGGVWTSSNPSIATIGSTGIVTGVSTGIDTISYTVTNACGTAVATKVVTVTASSGASCRIITTIAGSGTSTSTSGDGGPATSATMGRLFGLARDGVGNTYVSDFTNNRIRKIDTSGVITTFAGTGAGITSGDGGPATGAGLNGPSELALYGNNLYIAEHNSSRVRKVDIASGIITTYAGNGITGYSGDGGPATAAQISHPYGIGVDNAGNVYIPDQGTYRIRKVSAATGVITTFVGTGVAGNSGDGGPASAATIQLGDDIKCDTAGNIYFCDFVNNVVRKINTVGIITTIAGTGVGGFSGDGGSATAAKLLGPCAVLPDVHGNVYICDADNHRIRLINPSGVIATIAGIGSPGFSGDNGPALSAEVNRPNDMIFDATGNLYFCDIENHRVRKIALSSLSVSSISGPSSVCIGSTITLSDSTAGGIWSSLNAAVATVGSTGIVTGLGVGTTTISYTVTNACGAVSATKTITVTASPGLISGATSVCTGDTINLTNATLGGTWTSGNTSIATVGSLTGVVTGVATGNVVITYSLGASCQATTTVNVLSLPAVPSISGGTSVCIGLTTLLSNSMPGGFWYSTDASKATVSSSGLVTGISGGSVAIVYAVANSCGIGFNSVFVNISAPTPISGVPSVCVGATTTLSHSSPGGIWSSSNPLIASVGSASGIVTGMSFGTSTITYTMGPGCFATISVSVNASSVSITGTSSLCITTSAMLGGAPSGGTWSSSNPSVAAVGASGLVTGIASGTATISYTIGGGCYATKTVTVTTTGGPIMGTAGVCRGFTTTLIAPMPGGIWSSASTFFATVGSATGIVYGASPGTSVITYSVGAGCTSTITVTVRPVPAIMTVSGGGTFCAGGPGVNIGLPGSAVGINYQLYLGGIPVGSPLAGTGSSLSFGLQNIPGVYTVRAVDPVTLCQSNMTGGATVAAYPLPIIGVSPGVAICSGGSTILTASGGISYTWSPGTGLTSTAGSVVNAHPVTTTTYTVTGTSSFGCSNKVTVTVTVNPLPAISAGSGVAVCSGSSTTLTASGGTSYAWSPATGLSATTGATVMASPTTTRTYTVTGITSSGCTNRATVTVTVNPLPAISAGSGVSICNGASATLTASGGIGYEWSPPAGLSATTGASVMASPITSTTYTVSGTNSNGCANSATVRVTVNPLPIISTGPGVSICTGTSATLTASGAISYTWSPGTGLTSTAGSVVNAHPVTTTTYTVTGTNSFGCRNTATVTVTVNPLPTISTGSGLSICSGSSTILSASGGTGYTWSPATGLSATTGASVVASPTTTRTYTVTGTSSTGCIGRATVTVTVSSLPGIVACPGVAICYGASATLSASGGATYEWSPSVALSATTGASIVASPTVTTTYTVTGTNGTGCTNRATVTVTVNSLPTVSASSGGAICNGSSTTLSASGGVSYTWTPPTGLSATTGASITASPSVTTIYTVTGTNGSGCSNRATVTATVNASPSAISTTGNLCVGNSVTLTNATSGGVWSSSNPSIATIGSTTGVVTGVASGTTAISYTLSSGCRAISIVTVAALPSAISGPATIYSGSSVTYTNATSGGIWSSSNTAIVSIGSVTGIATGVATGTATISYTVSSGCGTTLLVSVSATPTVYTVTGGGVHCYGGAAVPIGLSGSQVGVTYRLYIGGVATGSPVSGTGGPITFGTFTTAGTYTVIANPSSSSPVTMTGSATVTVISSTMLPAPVAVTGGGTMCAGSPGLAISMPGSAVSVNYQLYRNGILTGSPLPGIGTALSFGLHAVPGSYTVIATSTVNGCSQNMLGGANITVFPTPNVYNVTGGGSFCTGVGGVVVGLSNSQSGINYQLYNGTSAVGSLRPGTGAAFNFSTVTASGIYSVVGISSYCTANMSGTATVSANPVPSISGSIYTVAPAASITLTGSISGGVWTSGTPSVATIGSSTGIVTGVTLGSSTIHYTLPTGCRGARVIYVTPTGHKGVSEDSSTYALFARRVYIRPNPNTGTFWISGYFGDDAEATLEIFNMLGQKVYSRVVRLQDGKLEEEITLESIANGTYLLNVGSTSYRDMFHIVVTK